MLYCASEKQIVPNPYLRMIRLTPNTILNVGFLTFSSIAFLYFLID